MVLIFAIGSAEPQGPDRGNGSTHNSTGSSVIDASSGRNSTATEAPTTNKLKRDSGLFTDDNDQLTNNKEGPPQIESV